MPASDKSSEKPLKLIIDELKMQDAQVVIHPVCRACRRRSSCRFLDHAEECWQRPRLAERRRDQGRRDGGHHRPGRQRRAVRLASPELKAVLQLNVGQVAGKLGAEAQKQIAAAIPASWATGCPRSSGPQTLAKDPARRCKESSAESWR